MLMAGDGVSGYIKAAGDAALAAGKVSEDIAFDAAGVDKVIQRLEDVIHEQMRHKMASRRREMSTRAAATPEDWASSSYQSSADLFGDNYGEWNDKYVARLKETVEKFKKVKAHYMAREDAIGEQFRSGLKK